MKKQRIEEEVDKTLGSVAGIERAEPNPFFLTRVEGRLAQRQSVGPTAWLFRPVWAVASLGLVLALNLSAVLYVREQLDRHEQEQESVGLTSEWGLDATLLDW